MKQNGLVYALFLLYNISIIAPVNSAITVSHECAEGGDCKETTEGKPFNAFGKWMDGVTANAKRFLDENVFNEQPTMGQKELTKKEKSDPFPHVTTGPKPQKDPFSVIGDAIASLFDDSSPQKNDDAPTQAPQGTQKDNLLSSIVQTAQDYASGKTSESRNFQQAWELFGNFFGDVMDQMKSNFEHIDFDPFNPIGMMYYVEHEDEIKNPSWKRRKHRFQDALSIDAISELHNALYVSHLSYAGTVEDIQSGLKQFLNNTYELIYSEIEGFPGEPAHFIAVKKEPAQIKGKWFKKPEAGPLEVMMVVRGTKEIGDMLSDGLLDAVDFRDGKAHAGIAKAGKYLVEQHTDLFLKLLDVSKRKSIRMSLVGHSLGAGAAAIAAMELNELDWIKATSIGFGCPALLNLGLSKSTKDFITTVVADSDVIPRMSGATISNMFLDVMSFDWTKKALEDIEMTLEFFKVPNREGLLQWANETMNKNDRPLFSNITKERKPPVLYPPGNCIHIYRDGIGFSGTYTPCSFFDQIDVSRTMVDDHLIPTGYHRAFLDLLRDNTKNLNFDFDHDVMALKV